MKFCLFRLYGKANLYKSYMSVRDKDIVLPPLHNIHLYNYISKIVLILFSRTHFNDTFLYTTFKESCGCSVFVIPAEDYCAMITIGSTDI